MEVLTRVAPSELVETGQIDVKAHVRVLDGAVILAESDRAVSTAWPEANGSLLVPEADVDFSKLRELGPGSEGVVQFASLSGEPIAWRHDQPSASGDALIGFSSKDLTILLADRQAGWEKVSTVDRFPRWGDITDLVHLMDVQPVGEDLFEAPTFGNVRRNVVEGGQLLGDIIVAAGRTDPGKRLISAHAIFSRPAIFDKTLQVAVNRSRMGRSFSTVSVEVTQDGKPISTGAVLLDSGADDLIRHDVEMPDIAGPQDAVPYDFGLIGRELRIVDEAYHPDPDRVGEPEIHAWMRHRWQPDDPLSRQAIIGQPTTHWTIASAMRPHKGYGEVQAHRTISTGVLSSTIYFHDDPDLTEWLLYSTRATHAGAGLAQGEGRIFTESGRLVATYSVQVMVRALIGAENGMKDDRLM
ncbi:MAG: thioesterase family protein [Novosphingobium sp.]|nr:thioesterase family protein [Novosphingobium sp.]